MRQAFQPSRSGRGPLIPVLGALALTALMFLILPLTQMLSTHYKHRDTFMRVDVALPPPPPPPPEPPPPPDDERQEEAPEMEREQQPLTLAQLEFAMNPGFGSAAATLGSKIEFKKPEVDAAKEILVYEVGQTDSNVSLTFYPQPQYPASLRRERIIGKAKLTFVVLEDGTVGTIERVDNPTHPDFIQVFMGWVKQWRFQPAMKDGKAVRQRVRQEVTLNP